MTPLLDGLTVLDLSRTFAGPLATMLLGDLGADVIKVERPGEGDETRSWPPDLEPGRGGYFCALNRNKRSVALDLTCSEDRSVMYALASRSDLVVQNFRPGVAQRLGTDGPALRARGITAVNLVISGFGTSGPYRDLPAYDPIVQAMSGLMSVTGEPDGPPVKSMLPVADLTSGLVAFGTALAALLGSERGTDVELDVDLSMLDVMVSSLTTIGAAFLNTGVVPGREGRRNPARVPSTGVRCADGRYLQFVPNDRQWVAFARIIGRPDWACHPDFVNNSARIRNQSHLYRDIEKIFAMHPRDYWVARLREAGIPCGPIHDLAEVFADEHVRGRDLVASVQLEQTEVLTVAHPFQHLARPKSAWLPPPRLGEHTGEVLQWLQSAPPRPSGESR